MQALPWLEPAQAFAAFAHDPHVAWLDGQDGTIRRAGMSVLAVEPFDIVESGDPFAALAQKLDQFRMPGAIAPVPFAGGAIGFLGYESARWLERVATPQTGALGIPEAVIGFYDVVLVWDHVARQVWLISSGLPESGADARAARARHRADAILARLATGRPGAGEKPDLRWHAETSRRVHEARVARALDYIASGDIYQANITSRFLAPRPHTLSAADIYLALRAENPAPYSAFLACGRDLAIASVSPERFVGLSADGDIEARPIKGTRPRGRDAAEDRVLREALLASEKDFAENLMIVDLLRNDISRVACFGSVTVPELAALETYAHLHHLVSVVHGRLRPGLAAADLLAACFPGGSITGAPKMRAMNIICELEGVPRGPYCGSIFWAGWDGAMDSSIAIRTVTIGADTVAVQAGGGIVADSDPADEYAEMLTKIRPLLRALGRDPT
jgi:para-aminobenzoate synthetase component 1